MKPVTRMDADDGPPVDARVAASAWEPRGRQWIRTQYQCGFSIGMAIAEGRGEGINEWIGDAGLYLPDEELSAHW